MKEAKLLANLDDVLENLTPAQREDFLTRTLDGMIKRYEATPLHKATGAEKKRFRRT